MDSSNQDTISDMTARINPLCPNCGYRSLAINGGGLIFSVPADEYLPLAGLIAGHLDEAKCESCKLGLKLPPTIMLMSKDANHVTVFFSPLVEVMTQESVDAIKSSLPRDWTVSIAETIEDLKREATRLVKTRAQILAAAQLAELNGHLNEHLDDHWQDLTAEVFTAGQVALTVPIPGVSVAALVPKDDPPGPIPDAQDAMRSLSRLQAKTLFAMWIIWHQHKSKSSLESDLTRHIRQGALAEGTAETTLQMLDGVASDDPALPFRSAYVLPKPAQKTRTEPRGPSSSLSPN
jgi:hypothetical protein